MPELPEVEVLVRYLNTALAHKTIKSALINRAKVILPTRPVEFARALKGATFLDVTRRGKYLLFHLAASGQRTPIELVGHLGMTGRMYLADANARLPKHAPVVLSLGSQKFVFEDTRYFGRLTLDTAAIARLGPEPLSEDFDPVQFARRLKRSKQAIKVRLLDQSLVAGIGNIYASEILFRAGVSPMLPAWRLTANQTQRLYCAVREILAEAIACGSTVPLNYGERGRKDNLFYFGRTPGTPDYYVERLRVYDRANQTCGVCGCKIKLCIQAGRSTYYCPHCQRR